MAGYRQFHTQFWKDEWLIDLEPLERYLFSYLFTNEQSSISGIYKIALKTIIYETGLSKEVVEKTLAKFELANKILYREGVMWVVNMSKFHDNASPQTQKKVWNDVDKIPDGIVKRAYLYHSDTGLYSIDTVLTPDQYQVLKDKYKDKAKQKATPGVVEFPPSLDCAEFRDKWDEWLKFRSEIKKRMTPTTQKEQFAMLSKHDPATAIAILQQSITNGWQGIFPIRNNGNGRTAPGNNGSAWQAKKQSRIMDALNASTTVDEAGI